MEPTTHDRAPSTPRPKPQVQAPSAEHTALLGFLVHGFVVMGFWSWLLGFVFWMLNAGCKCLRSLHLALGCWCLMQGAGICCLRFRALGFEHPVPNTEHQRPTPSTQLSAPSTQDTWPKTYDPRPQAPQRIPRTPRTLRPKAKEQRPQNMLLAPKTQDLKHRPQQQDQANSSPHQAHGVWVLGSGR